MLNGSWTLRERRGRKKAIGDDQARVRHDKAEWKRSPNPFDVEMRFQEWRWPPRRPQGFALCRRHMVTSTRVPYFQISTFMGCWMAYGAALRHNWRGRVGKQGLFARKYAGERVVVGVVGTWEGLGRIRSGGKHYCSKHASHFRQNMIHYDYIVLVATGTLVCILGA